MTSFVIRSQSEQAVTLWRDSSALNLHCLGVNLLVVSIMLVFDYVTSVL